MNILSFSFLAHIWPIGTQWYIHPKQVLLYSNIHKLSKYTAPMYQELKKPKESSQKIQDTKKVFLIRRKEIFSEATTWHRFFVLCPNGLRLGLQASLVSESAWFFYQNHKNATLMQFYDSRTHFLL